MEENIKPNIEGLKREGVIIFGSSDSRFDNVNTLTDKNIKGSSEYGFLFYPGTYLTFKIAQKSNIYTYGIHYSDGGGASNKNVKLYKKTNEEFVLITDSLPTKSDEWYLLFENLEKGEYKVEGTGNYTVFTEWYVENLEKHFKCLIQQNNNYYSINKHYIDITKENNNLEELIKEYGYNDISILTKELSNKKVPTRFKDNHYESFDIELNDVKYNVCLIEEDNKKYVQYDCDTYRILDKIKENNNGKFDILMNEIE